MRRRSRSSVTVHGFASHCPSRVDVPKKTIHPLGERARVVDSQRHVRWNLLKVLFCFYFFHAERRGGGMGARAP